VQARVNQWQSPVRSTLGGDSSVHDGGNRGGDNGVYAASSLQNGGSLGGDSGVYVAASLQNGGSSYDAGSSYGGGSLQDVSSFYDGSRLCDLTGLCPRSGTMLMANDGHTPSLQISGHLCQ
jgi:hypothetical protein